jgi:hypothetical protein
MGEFLASGSFRRAVIAILGGGVAVLHRKFGLDMDPADVATLGGVIVAYLIQSSSKEKKLAEIDAAGAAAAMAATNPVATFSQVTTETKPTGAP